MIELLEEQFKRIDNQLESINLSNQSSDLILDLIQTQITNGLNKARELYINDLNKSLSQLLNNKFLLKQNKLTLIVLNFIPNYRIQTFTNDILINLILFNNETNLIQKLKYLNLTNTFKEIQLNEQPQPQQAAIYLKCKKLYLTNKLLFQFVEFQKRMCFMQIKTITNIELFRSRTIHLKQFEQYDFISFNNKICGLFHDDDTFILKLFDSKLQLLKFKRFNYRISLHSINSNDIICYTNNKQERYLVLDHDLNKKFGFGQKEEETKEKTVFVADSSLIQLNALFIYLLYYDLKSELNYLKIISRPFGECKRMIKLGNRNEIKSCLIKIGLNCIFIKIQNLNLIKLFKLNGEFMFEIKNDYVFSHFKSIDLNLKENELFYLDNKNKKLFII
jgi:hypothetical protein